MQYSIENCESPFDFLPTVAALDTAELVAEHFQEVITGYGGIYVLMCRVPKPHEALADCILMDTRPPAWARRYRNKGYMNTDPLVLTAQRRVLPCTWSDAMAAFPDDPTAQLIHKERLAYGVTDGLLVPIHSTNGRAALVSIGTNAVLTDEALDALTMMSLVAHNILSAMQQSDPTELGAFTAREIECAARQSRCEGGVNQDETAPGLG